MAGGPEDHFTDSGELCVLVEDDEWAHAAALHADAGYRPAGLRNSSTGGAGRESRNRAVVPSAAG